MNRRIENRIFVILTLFTLFLSSCTAAPTPSPTPTLDITQYAFPAAIDPAQRYLFYLHGKIIEDQGLPAVSPDFGEYEYGAILSRFKEAGFTVIAEVRPKEADGYAYAEKVKSQVVQLLDTGVPADNITVVGASKGASIAAAVSYLLDDDQIKYVLLGSCYVEMIPEWKTMQWYLHGNVLSIYDSVDELSGSCRELFAMSAGKGITRSDEIVLHIGAGHGILYKPLDEWILPTIEWANK